MIMVSSTDSPRRSVSLISIIVCARSMAGQRAAPGAGRRSSGRWVAGSCPAAVISDGAPVLAPAPMPVTAAAPSR